MDTFLLIIAVLTLGFILATLFTSLVDTVVDMRSSTPLPVGSPEFFRAIEGITRQEPIALHNDVTLLNNCDEFLPDFLEEMSRATSSITVANYIWSEGELANSVLECVIERAKEGVQVRILMDGLGKTTAPRDLLDKLKQNGGKVAVFRPIALRTFTRVMKRSHLRAMVIDGRIGYIGGIAFKDTWLGNGVGEKSWRDIMFKIEGRAAREIQHMFNGLWRETDGEILSGENFYPEMQTSTSAGRSDTKLFSLFHAPSPDLDKSLTDLLWISFAGARERILITTPYLLPHKHLLKILKKKAREGIDVQIVLPGKYVDTRSVQAASRSFYLELLGAGVKIFEYQAGLFHSKVFVVDGIWSIIGSANLDNRSIALNVEGLLAVHDHKLAQEIEHEFELDRSRSKEVLREEFKENVLERLMGRASRIFVKQY